MFVPSFLPAMDLIDEHEAHTDMNSSNACLANFKQLNEHSRQPSSTGTPSSCIGSIPYGISSEEKWTTSSYP